jgi:hypothetical protein
MVHATLSPEGQIQSGLRSINCSIRQFTEIATCMNIPVSHVLISTCLNGQREFNSSTAESLLALMKELLALRDYFSGVPIRWAVFEDVSTLLVKRRAELAGMEVDRAAETLAGV